MSPETKLVFLMMLCIVLSCQSANGVAEDDVYCLESFKGSLEDPESTLSSWDFTNKTTNYLCSRFVGISCWNDRENRLLSLELRGMNLKGNFPLGLEYCGSLTKLDLSGNQLSGSIPSDLCERVRFLTLLDLSNNFFSGEIPASIVACIYLNTLALNNNSLSGGIPEGMERLSRLQSLNLSDNELVGAVPMPLRFGAESYVNNKALCGGPLEPCKEESLVDYRPMFMLGFGIGWFVSAVLFLYAMVLFQSPLMVVTSLAYYIIVVFSFSVTKRQR